MDGLLTTAHIEAKSNSEVILTPTNCLRKSLEAKTKEIKKDEATDRSPSTPSPAIVMTQPLRLDSSLGSKRILLYNVVCVRPVGREVSGDLLVVTSERGNHSFSFCSFYGPSESSRCSLKS